MRKIEVSVECKKYFESENDRVEKKFYQLVEVLVSVEVIPSKVVKKLICTGFYELRIKAGNEYRVVLFAYDHQNVITANKAILLNAF